MLGPLAQEDFVISRGDAQVAGVEQGMDVGPEENPVGGDVGMLAPVGNDVGCFQGFLDVVAGDSAALAVDRREHGPETGLALANPLLHQLPIPEVRGRGIRMIAPLGLADGVWGVSRVKYPVRGS